MGIMYSEKEQMNTDNISWNAIFAGVTVALVTTALLNILGIGLGFNIVNIDSDSITNTSIGTFIWFIVSGTVSMFVGGWLASFLATPSSSFLGTLHGVVMWCLTTILAMTITITTFSILIGGTMNTLGNAISYSGKTLLTTSQSLTQAIPQNHIEQDIKSETNSIIQTIQEEISIDNNEAKKSLKEAVTALFTAKDEQAVTIARQKLTELLVQNKNMDTQQAEKKINEWQQNFNVKKEQVKQTAIVTTQKTVSALGTMGISTFFILLLGAIASALGGMFGSKRM